MKITLEHILVPTDFSDESRAAPAYGVALAETFGASLHLLHVLEVIASPEPLPVQFETRQLGTHGRGGLKRLILGRVAESVVRGAPCPVLTIHPERELVTPSAEARRRKRSA